MSYRFSLTTWLKGNVSLTVFVFLKADWSCDKCLGSEDLQLIRISRIPPERET